MKGACPFSLEEEGMVAERRYWNSGIAETAECIEKLRIIIRQTAKLIEQWEREDVLLRTKIEALHEEIEIKCFIFGLTVSNGSRTALGSECREQLGRNTKSCRTDTYKLMSVCPTRPVVQEKKREIASHPLT